MLRFTLRAVVVGSVFLAATCLGYGGFEVTGSLLDFNGLNKTLTALNQKELHGSGQFTQTGPLWWLGGHGGNQVGVVTFGGSGAIGVRASHADSLGSEMLALRGNFEAGYPAAPVDWFWVRPCLEVSLAGWYIYAHSVESGTLVGDSKPNFSREFWGWTLGAVPGIEIMGRLPSSRESFIALFAKGSYFLPFAGPEWFGDVPPPKFDLRGFNLQVGLRFGKMSSYRAFHI